MICFIKDRKKNYLPGSESRYVSQEMSDCGGGAKDVRRGGDDPGVPAGQSPLQSNPLVRLSIIALFF